MALALNPLPQTELVLSRAQQLRLLLGVLVALRFPLATGCPFELLGYALTSYKTRRTLPCRDEVEVSVLTPPKLVVRASEAPRCEKAGVTLWESREPAGRAARRADRANTIVNKSPEKTGERYRAAEMCVYVARELRAGARGGELLPSSMRVSAAAPLLRTGGLRAEGRCDLRHDAGRLAVALSGWLLFQTIYRHRGLFELGRISIKQLATSCSLYFISRTMLRLSWVELARKTWPQKYRSSAAA